MLLVPPVPPKAIVRGPCFVTSAPPRCSLPLEQVLGTCGQSSTDRELQEQAI